jgi:toxin ParE1/3/4
VTWPRFHPEAEREFDEAFDLLARDSADMAGRLVERTGATLRMLREFPQAGRSIGRLNRRFPVRPFPYHLVYLQEEGDLYGVAFAHDRRQPEYWLDRVQT